MTVPTLLRLAAPALALAVLALGATTAPSAHAGRIRAFAAPADGGFSSFHGVARHGPRGGVLRGRTVTTDGHGNGHVSSRAVAQGSHGSVVQAATASRDASGNASASRQATFTNAANGHTAHATTSYSRTDGAVTGQRTVTCQDAAGTTISCR